MEILRALLARVKANIFGRHQLSLQHPLGGETSLKVMEFDVVVEIVTKAIHVAVSVIELMPKLAVYPTQLLFGSAGLAMVNLCCHLAWACRIPDAAAFRIVCDVYEWQSQGGIKRKPPVSSLNSFRVLKNRLMELRPAA